MASDDRPPAAISCIMPVFNGSAYIAAAVDSILAQSLPPREIIVVDDGSTDDSAERALAAGGDMVTLVRQSNQGIDAARNAGLAAASGDYVHFFDADDILPPGALEAMHHALDRDPPLDAVFGQWVNFWIPELEHESDEEGSAYLKGIQTGMMLTAGLFRRELLMRGPPFPTDAGWQGAVAWIQNLLNSGIKLGRIEETTLHRRVHFSNVSRKKSLNELAELALSLHRAARARRNSAPGLKE